MVASNISLLKIFFFPRVFLGRGLSRHAFSKPVVCIWSYNQKLKKKILLLAAKRKSRITFNEWLECGNQKNRVDGLERRDLVRLLLPCLCCGFSAAVCTGCTHRVCWKKPSVMTGASSLTWPALRITQRPAPWVWTSQPPELEEITVFFKNYKVLYLKRHSYKTSQ